MKLSNENNPYLRQTTFQDEQMSPNYINNRKVFVQ